MRNYIHVVTIATTEYVDIARAFTDLDDANAFIEDCKKHEPSTRFTYEIQQLELDGDPLTGY